MKKEAGKREGPLLGGDLQILLLSLTEYCQVLDKGHLPSTFHQTPVRRNILGAFLQNRPFSLGLRV